MHQNATVVRWFDGLTEGALFYNSLEPPASCSYSNMHNTYGVHALRAVGRHALRGSTPLSYTLS
jgi:hypothetical protein